MFEKEAEEYRESKRHKSFREDVGNIQIDYNVYLNNLAIAFKDGCNKANEWHNLEENPNDLPTENMKQVIVMTNFSEYLMGWYSHVDKTWWSSDCPDPDDRIETEDILKVKVTKWKEIK